MPVSGVTVTVDSRYADQVKEIITETHGGEISAEIENQLVVVLEAPSNHEMKIKFEAIAGLDGVVVAQLAYYSEEV